ncbi:MAG: acyl-CoA dehydrogenase family protein [Pseudomonadales bacterium]|jgi:alkylation response protein AidB-like acyl-CoA dehydrogenase|nr:acyl-CoA dehydrogenase family protein [Pseudomonadales bacterium]
MGQALTFDPVSLPEEAEALRGDVRRFVAETLGNEHRRNSDFGASHDPDFSRALGARGWIGMTWPSRYGGGERSFFERYVVTEELLAAGAPVGAHWIADRQSGPLLLRYGTEEQREFFLPRIVRGECFFSIGMSEPDSGSDLASVRTTATRVDGGWVVNGTKLWSSGAHRNHYMITLVRTEPQGENRHAGLSQLIVDLRDSEGLTVRPIANLAGDAEFNEVVFEDCFVPENRLVGEPGNGWAQVTSELGYERSGPERFLSAFRVFVELVREIGPEPTEHQAAVLGRFAAHMMTLRKMSISVAGMLQSNRNPVVEAALVKELGNNFERELPEIARLVAPASASALFRRTLEDTILHAPSFTIRGGTREILRGMIARGLGLR